MRIRSKLITREDIIRAARASRTVILQCDAHNATRGRHGFEITLGGLSKSRTQRFRDERAATYNQWGVFLNVLFEIDPEMIAGTGYKGADAFHAITRYAFADVDTYSTDGDIRVARHLR